MNIILFAFQLQVVAVSSVHQDGAFLPLGNVTPTMIVVTGVMSRVVVGIGPAYAIMLNIQIFVWLGLPLVFLGFGGGNKTKRRNDTFTGLSTLPCIH